MALEDKLIQIAENEQKVYEAGKDAFYDFFWDNFQQNGTRGDYSSSFGACWSKETFKPKYTIAPTNAYMMFMYFAKAEAAPMDFVEMGIDLDLSKCTVMTQLFSDANISRVGVVDCRKTRDGGRYAFASSKKLVTIEKLIFLDTPFAATNTFQYTFQSCEALVNINAIEGKICNNGLSLQWSTKLSKQSIINIINALSSTTTGLTITFSKTAINNAFGINIDNESTYTTEWNTLRGSKSNWSFSFA